MQLKAEQLEVNLVEFAIFASEANKKNILVDDNLRNENVVFIINDSNDFLLEAFEKAVNLKGLELIEHKNFYYVQKSIESNFTEIAKYRTIKLDFVNFEDIENKIAQLEKEIKNLSTAYTKIASEILPQLRRSKMKLVMDVVGKSDEEILAAAKQNPSSLTVEELIYAGKIAQDKSLKTASAEQVVALYPEDWRGYNNLAALKIEAGQTAEASKLLATAAQKGGDQPQINYNLGLVELTKNNYTKAKEYFGKAAGVGESLAEAQGVAYIQAGQYDKAVSAFGNTTSNNAALAQILNGNYQKATAIADACQNKTADTYYLKAIAGARSNNKDQVISSLKSAIQKDSSYAKKAASDMEFAKYLVDADFLSVAK